MKKMNRRIKWALSAAICVLFIATAFSVALCKTGDVNENQDWSQEGVKKGPIEEKDKDKDKGCNSDYKSDSKVGVTIPGTRLSMPFGYINVTGCRQITFLFKYQEGKLGEFRTYFKTGPVLACYDEVAYGPGSHPWAGAYHWWLTYGVIGEEVCPSIEGNPGDTFDIYYYASS